MVISGWSIALLGVVWVHGTGTSLKYDHTKLISPEGLWISKDIQSKLHCSAWLPRSSCSSFTWSYFRLLPLPCIHTTLSSAIDHPEITTLIYDHVKLDQKGLYVTLRAGHVAQGTAGLYVPRPANVCAVFAQGARLFAQGASVLRGLSPKAFQRNDLGALCFHPGHPFHAPTPSACFPKAAARRQWPPMSRARSAQVLRKFVLADPTPQKSAACGLQCFLGCFWFLVVAPRCLFVLFSLVI